MKANKIIFTWLVWLLLSPVLLLLCGPAHTAAAAAAAETEDKATLEHEAQQIRTMLTSQPSNTMLQLQLATTLHRLNHLSPNGGQRVPEAVKAYRAVLHSVQDTPATYIQIQGNLAALLLSGDQPEAAIEELQSALQLVEQHHLPLYQYAGLLFNLGKALTTTGKISKSDKTYMKAAQAAYGHDFGTYSKAIAAPTIITEDAARLAVEVAAVARLHFQQQQGLEFLKDVKLPVATDVMVLHGNQLEWIKASTSMDLVWVHFAIHKYYHSKKQYVLAWEYLAVGNKLMSAHTPHRQAVEEHNLHHIKVIFRAPIVTGGLQDDSAIFVVGMPRSGSTLVEQMLASHSQVFAAGEDTALAPLTTEINHVLSRPGVDHVKQLRKFGKRYLRRMRERVPKHDWPDSNGPKRIVDKMLRNLWLVGYIEMLLPKSCIIHVARHPMDVALSCYAQPFGYSASSLSWAWDLDTIARQLEMAWEIVDHWEQQLPGRLHTVLYEDLVAHPELAARKLLEACGLEWQDSVLQFQATDRPVHTASMVQVRQPLYKSSVARWKVYEQQLAGLKKRLSPIIAKYEQLLHLQLAAHDADADEAAGPEFHRAAAAPGSEEQLDQLGSETAAVDSKDEL